MPDCVLLVQAEINAAKGEISVKMAPTAVGAEEEEALKKALEEAQRANEEIEGDDDDDDDE